MTAVAFAQETIPTHFFADFELSTGWKAGSLPEGDPRVMLVQGQAEIVEFLEEDSRWILEIPGAEPFGAVSVDATPLGNAPVAFCEVLARPVAVDEATDEEFFDFAGAVVGFFRNGEHGEFRVLFEQTESESVWISTGPQFDLNSEGEAREWVRVAVRLDRLAKRWDIAVNDKWEITGLRVVTPAERGDFSLRLYGHERGTNRFDDILLSEVPPGEVESAVARRSRSLGPSRPGRQIVTGERENSDLRRAKTGAAEASVADVSPKLRGWSLVLDTGNRTYMAVIRNDGPNDGPAITAYAPGYDEDGHRLPAVVTITADAELRPGVDLARLRWRVSELLGWPDKIGDTFGEGDFRTGLVQKFTLTPEMTRKASRVSVWAAAR